MANNEIKVTIKADNKPFLESLKQCTNEMKKFAQSAGNMKIDISQLGRAEKALEKLSDALKAVKGGQTVTVGADVSQALAALREVETAAKSQDTKIAVGVDKAQAIADIDGIQQALSKLSATLSSISVDNSQAVKAAQETKETLASIPDEKVKLKLDVESKEAMNALKQLAGALKNIKESKVNLQVGGNAQADLAKLEERMRNLRSSLKSITVKVNTRTALKNLEKLIHAARQLRNDLKGVKLPAGNSAMASSLARVAALNRQILKTMKDISAETKKMSTGMGGTSKATESTLSKLGNLSLVAQGAAQIFETIKDMASTIVMPGFNFTKEMEMNQLGIAGILQSMTLLNGQAVEFSQAMGISSDMMQKLQKDAIKTSATTGELVETFRAVLAPGIGAGMSLDEIQEFTTVGVNAVKAMGLQSNQFVQELRDLVQGGIAPASSTLATALGLTDADIKAAKASSEGLFKFLMERLKGFQPMAEKFPDTLQGKMSQLEEMSTLASAEITKAFESDFKEIVGYITSLLGDLNTKTGEFEVNPALLDVIDELKDGLQTLKDYIADLDDSGAFEWVDEAVPTLKSLYNILKDVGGVLMDMMRIMEAAAAPINEFIWSGIRLIASEVEWLTGKIRALINTLSIKIGAKKERIDARQIQDVADESRELYKNPYVNTKQITGKYPSKAQEEAAKKAEKERLKAAQAAMKEMLRYWKDKLDAVQREFKRQQDALELRKDQGAISSDEYYLQKLKNEIAAKEQEQANLQERIRVVESTDFGEEKQGEKKSLLDALGKDYEIASEDLKDLTAALDETVAALGKFNTVTPEQAVEKYGLNKLGFAGGEGKTWYKASGENPKYDALEDNAKQALERVAQYVYDLTGEPLALTSGKRSAELGYSASEIGGHYTGMKFDAVAEALNNPEVRQKVIDFAESIGIGVLDEYANPTLHASGRHLDFNAADYAGGSSSVGIPQGWELQTRQAYEAVKARMEMRGKAQEVLRHYSELMGDISSYQLKAIEAEQAEIEKQLQQYPNDAMARQALAVLDEVMGGERRKVRLSQTSKDLEEAYAELEDAQEELFYEMDAGIKNSGEITEEYAKRLRELLDGRLTELQAQLAEAMKHDDKGLAREIRDKIREVVRTIGDGFKAILNKIDAEANEEIEKITQNKSMTRLQKDDAIDAVKRRAAEDKIEVLKGNISDWQAARSNINQDEEKQAKFQKKHGGLTIDIEGHLVLEKSSKVERTRAPMYFKA